MQQKLSTLLAALARSLLPSLLKVNPVTAAKGKERLLREYDYFDQKLSLQLKGGEAAVAAAAGGGGGDSATAVAAAAGGGGGETQEKAVQGVGYYLCGDCLTAADVSLATLAAPLLGLGDAGLNPRYSPGVQEFPEEMQELVEVRAEEVGRRGGQGAIAFVRQGAGGGQGGGGPEGQEGSRAVCFVVLKKNWQ